MGRMRRVTLVVGIGLTIGGLGLYLFGSPSLNQSPVGHGYGNFGYGYGYQACPHTIEFTAGPDGGLKGSTFTFSGRLVPEAGGNTAGENITILRKKVGTNTEVFVTNATTNSTGNFSGSFILNESSRVFARWDTNSGCTDLTSAEVLVRVLTFFDVPVSHFAFDFVEQIAAAGVTVGCRANPPLYCPSSATTRAQMSIFILRSIGHAGHLLPYRGIFADVPASHPQARFIEHLWDHGITAGCDTSPRRYCPSARVTRGEMAVFILRGMDHAGDRGPYEGTFADVPASHPYALFIEHLFEHGVTAGCTTSGALRYCPSRLVSRAEMAVFLVRAFDP